MKIRRKIIILFITLSIFSCAGKKAVNDIENPVELQEPEPVWIYDFQPKGSKLYFLGISERMKNRDDEYEIARQFASIQAALYKEAGGQFRTLTHESNVIFGRKEEGNIFYNPDTALQMYESLDEEHIYKNESFTAILYSLESPFNNFPSVKKQINSTQPVWISSPPSFEGYYTGVAMVEPYKTFSETIKAADNRVLREILSQKELKVTGEYSIANRSTETQNHSDSSDSLYQKATGAVYGFYILARWQDPEGRLYSLGICSTH